MRKYFGLLSIGILIGTFLVLQSLVGKQVGHLWGWIIAIGYVGAAWASWYSDPGFWRKASAVILVLLPVGFILVVGLFIVGLRGAGF
ncbi:hypothetical protein [Rossellomorea vietnamensis]|uniref:Uncharacterized protein n=1 Tax=Rossellomorea vietnamensis TaxID=218284 RepID=A0A6I6UNP5_9BACI|nr:hypothetical protein [Rossellomorea vietnamensis]OXS64503.1 hypothetical protein B1B00_01910 [Bacillus sp. DSM 27956]PRX79659.1 hypothetical protein B0G93_101409 [Bacillus sp. V-88]QHE60293.1 hypothetical protein FHE72_04000 [Rossellomorea vietnamensis]SLK01182.1 hypothetical protein SAMN06295884_101409 [Bacillus sp. V-88]